jgi:hypothetical protein
MPNYTLQEKVQIVEHLMNEINKLWIKCKGEMFNNKDFWDETLHSFTNEDWSVILDVMELIRLEDPRCYLPFSYDTFQEARKVITIEGHDANPRALNARKNKKKSFKALMHAKDCWNAFVGYEAPTKFKPDPVPPTPFENLFKSEENESR